MLTAEAGRRAIEAGLQAAREDLARAQARRDSGAATDADVLSLVAHVADLQQRSIQFRSDAGIARAELNRLMGAPVNQAFDVTAPQPSARAEADLDALLAEADRARPELKRASVGTELADGRFRNVRVLPGRPTMQF